MQSDHNSVFYLKKDVTAASGFLERSAKKPILNFNKIKRTDFSNSLDLKRRIFQTYLKLTSKIISL